jgi:hypothetical protein
VLNELGTGITLPSLTNCICLSVCLQNKVQAPIWKNSIFWDTTPCGPMKVNWRFGGTYRHHLRDLIIRKARNQHEVGSKLCFAWFLVRLILRPWRWRWYIPPKRWLTFNNLHGIISQKTVLFLQYLGTWKHENRRTSTQSLFYDYFTHLVQRTHKNVFDVIKISWEIQRLR